MGTKHRYTGQSERQGGNGQGSTARGVLKGREVGKGLVVQYLS